MNALEELKNKSKDKTILCAEIVYEEWLTDLRKEINLKSEHSEDE